jgi:membrane associated rhomboid family serine protease
VENIPEEHNPEIGKRAILKSLIWPFIFAISMWVIKLSETAFDIRFTTLGLKPRTIDGLIGIVTSPFIHADYLHLISNTIPLLILGAALIYFYKPIAFKVFVLIFFLTGIWVWLAGRPSYHIGASGVVYGLAFFLFLSGIFRKDRSLMAFSLLVVFLYGSIIWGILPIESGMSWEGHLFGALSGIICAFAFKNEGPQRKKFDWEEEEDEDDEDPNEINQPEQQPPGPLQINYDITNKRSGDTDAKS